MTARRIPLTLLLLSALATSNLYAKKTPKFEQTRTLTPEQSALAQKAIDREKVLIKEIQDRTPLVETYIQDTRPDVKLYQVPVDWHRAALQQGGFSDVDCIYLRHKLGIFSGAKALVAV